jgi:hypothetical protein
MGAKNILFAILYYLNIEISRFTFVFIKVLKVIKRCGAESSRLLEFMRFLIPALFLSLVEGGLGSAMLLQNELVVLHIMSGFARWC